MCPAVTVTSTGTGNIRVSFVARAKKNYTVYVHEDEGRAVQVYTAGVNNAASSPVSKIQNFDNVQPGTYYIEVRETGSTKPCALKTFIGGSAAMCPTITFTGITTTEVTANYTASPGATKYFLEIRREGQTSGFTSAETSNLTHLFSGLTPGALHTVTVFPYINGAYVNTCLGETFTTAAGTQVQWMYADDANEPSDLANLNYNHSQALVPGSNISIPVTDMVANQWIVVKFPATEPNPTTWFNTVTNSGPIGDPVFPQIVTIGGSKYIKSNSSISLDATQPLIFSH